MLLVSFLCFLPDVECKLGILSTTMMFNLQFLEGKPAINYFGCYYGLRVISDKSFLLTSQYWFLNKIYKMIWLELCTVVDLRGTPAPPPGPNSFNFKQFLGEFGKVVCWRLPPPPEGWRSHLGEILDPPLM